MDAMLLFRFLLGAPVAAATLSIGGLAIVEIARNLALLRSAERIPARIHARRGPDDVTATVGDGADEQEIPVRAGWHETLRLLDPVVLLKPREGLPVVGTCFQLWFRPVTCILFALAWVAFGAWLFRSVAHPPPLPSPPLFELHAAPGYWKGPAFWSMLPLLLLGVACFGKSILLPVRLLMLSAGLGFLILLVGLVADSATLTIAAWPGAVQRQSIVSWEKAELAQVKHVVEFKSVHYRYSSTLKEWTRDLSIPPTTTLQLRDEKDEILAHVDESLEPAGRQRELLDWLLKETRLPLEHEESKRP
ncbi:MAG: hypothetical protein JO332_06510 [Planctomycetaceae bacterium]|nr:hypothetical protein [Planctomycetaceae bacterium]